MKWEERFWKKVRKTDTCWWWTGGKTDQGYGQLEREKKRLCAHRYAWEITNGPIPDGLWVLHHCDNPSCVRPDHLFLGTNKDNLDDMYAKGRGPTGARNGRYTHPERTARGDRSGSRIHPESRVHLYGEQNPMAKLTSSTVEQIRSECIAGTKQRDAAKKYGISQQEVSKIVIGLRWSRGVRNGNGG